jgi:hypothetical protein
LTEDILKFVLLHWPFVAVAAILATIGEAMKRRVITKELAARSRLGWWLRATMPVHPIGAGVLLGLLPGMPAPPGFDGSTAGRCLYFAGAGVLSVFLFDLIARYRLLKGLAKPSLAPPSNGVTGAGDGDSLDPPR